MIYHVNKHTHIYIYIYQSQDFNQLFSSIETNKNIYRNKNTFYEINFNITITALIKLIWGIIFKNKKGNFFKKI